MTRRAFASRIVPHLAVAVAGFVIAYLLIAFFVFPGRSDDAEIVPNVVGTAYDDAVRSLEQRGFTTERGEPRILGTVSPGTVVEQNPAGGSRQPKGTRVVLHVSASDRAGAAAPRARPARGRATRGGAR